MFKRLLIIVIPILLMILINESSEKNTHKFLKEKCTRHCHNISCKHHNTTGFKNYLYQKNILLLKQNNLGLSYKQVNILVYVIGFPLIILLLFFNLIRTKNEFFRNYLLVLYRFLY